MNTCICIVRSTLYCFLLSIFLAVSSRAGNPIVYGVGLCDPHGVAYGDRVFLYCSDDGNHMKDWWAWSSDNLVDWKEECRLLPKDTFLARDIEAGKKIQGCWATFGTSKNGKYYWYFCSGDQIGVVVADLPAASIRPAHVILMSWLMTMARLTLFSGWATITSSA